jgi:hypothetical protein
MIMVMVMVVVMVGDADDECVQLLVGNGNKHQRARRNVAPFAATVDGMISNLDMPRMRASDLGM